MSKNVFTGFVSKINSKSGQGKRGPWTAWSFRLEEKDGTEVPQWFRLGFKEPTVKEGDYIRFSCSEVQENFASVDVDSIQVSKAPPDRVKKAEAKGSSSGGGSGYNSVEQRADRAYHAARGSAIELVGVLLANKALSLSEKTTKAGQAKRFEEIGEAVDKITVKFFRDEFPEFDGEFRQLAKVDDYGAVVVDEVVGDLPEAEQESEDEEGFPEEETNDEGFPEEDLDDDGFLD